MQRVVSDSEVIIHLAKLNELNLIRELYECAHVPRYVELEMVRYQSDEVGIIEDAVRHGVLKVNAGMRQVSESNQLRGVAKGAAETW